MSSWVFYFVRSLFAGSIQLSFMLFPPTDAWLPTENSVRFLFFWDMTFQGNMVSSSSKREMSTSTTED